MEGVRIGAVNLGKADPAELVAVRLLLHHPDGLAIGRHDRIVPRESRERAAFRRRLRLGLRQRNDGGRVGGENARSDDAALQQDVPA